MTTIPVLSEEHIDQVPLPVIAHAIRNHIINDALGTAVSPARQRVQFPAGDLVFTTGGDGSRAGFRVYETFEGPTREADDQIVAVWNQQTRRLRGIALGRRLGAIRTGVIGGIAVDVMAAPAALCCGVVGAGLQAETQLRAICALRRLEQVRVYSRTAISRSKFAERMDAQVTAEVRAVDTARECVRDADIVVLATNSRKPVIDASWIAAGAHVTTLGPKARGAHEFPLVWAGQAAVIASDSPQQIMAQGDQHMLEEGVRERVVHLGRLADGSGSERLRRPTLFLSAGLAGTEVVALDAALAHFAENGDVPKRPSLGR